MKASFGTEITLTLNYEEPNLLSLGYEIYSVETENKFGRKELVETVKQRRTMDCLCLPN